MACAVPDATPGVPLAALAGTNAEVVESYPDLIMGGLEERLLELCKIELSFASEVDNLVYCERGLCDAIRMFVKKEPHKWQKIAEGRYRLICSVSLTDSLIEKALYLKRAKLEIGNWEDIPSKPGMGASDEAIQSLALQILRMAKENEADEILDTDVKGWDWQVKRWMMICALYANCLLMGVKPGTDYFRALRNREIIAGRPVLSDTNGLLYELVDDSLWLSGRFITSKGNSKQRTLLSVIAGTENIAMGDDCNEVLQPGNSIERALEVYDRMGFSSKLMEVTINKQLVGTVFCSLRFYEDDGNVKAEPVNWVRTLYRLISKDYNISELMQFRQEVRNVRGFPAELHRLLLQKFLVAEEGSRHS